MKLIWFSLLVSAAFASCNLYKPGKVYTPLLESQHDGNVSVSFGRTFGAQASYSPLKNIGVLLNYTNSLPVYEYQTIDNEPDEVLINTYRNQQLEFGLGYYEKLTDQYYFEIYAGYGKGESGVVEDLYLIRSYEEDNVSFEAIHEYWFIQPTFSVKFKKSFSFSLSAKLSNTTFYNFNSSQFFEPPPNFFVNSTILSIQPCMSLDFGNDWLRGTIQTGLFLADQSRFYTARVLNGSIGFGVNLNQLKKTIKEKKEYKKSSGDYFR
tara:strand:+ start:4711 stop:5505 length:795 start_codon:yes stop_codon:yes gene_type:complete